MSPTEGSTAEGRARAAMQAIAATVTAASPIQFVPAADPALRRDELGFTPGDVDEQQPLRSAPGSRRPAPRRPGRRRRSWAAPLSAAAVVVALAFALVLVKEIPNGGVVLPGTTVVAPPAPGGIPRYYVALQQFAGKAYQGASDTIQNEIVVGDSRTGDTLAKFTPPARTTFQSVTGAADDRTFVAFAVTSSNGQFNSAAALGATMTGRWYEVRLAPGTAHPASLIPLPIKPESWQMPKFGAPYYQPGVAGIALSASGQELAIGEIPARGIGEVKVVSLATGQLLDDWTTNDPFNYYNPVPILTWIDSDRDLAVATGSAEPGQEAAIRELNVAGPSSGSITAVSRVILSGRIASASSASSSTSCFGIMDWPPLLSPGGEAASCASSVASATAVRLVFSTVPTALGTSARHKSIMDYQTAFKVLSGPYFTDGVLWSDPSGGALIGEWGHGLVPSADSAGPTIGHGLEIGVISHGTFTPLRFPASLAETTPTTMAW